MQISCSTIRMKSKSLLRFILQSLGGCLSVLCVALLGYTLHCDPSSAGFLLILVVVAEAILAGFWQASVVSIWSFLCFDFFFYEPYLSLQIAAARDWIPLCVFEVTALTVSRISSKARRNALEARKQRTLIEQCYELSRSTLFLNLYQPPAAQLVQLIHTIFSVEAVAIFDAALGETAVAGNWPKPEMDAARTCFVLNADSNDAITHTLTFVLRAGMRSIGALALRGDIPPEAARALTSMAAVALDRSAAFEKEGRIEKAHRSERLRAAVLDSLAHAVKTPLTAIQTASAGISEVGSLNNAQTMLASLIENEALKLNALCTQLLQTAQLESNELSLRESEVAVARLVQQVVRGLARSMAGHAVEVQQIDPSLSLYCDSEMLSMVLTEFLMNAAKYSFPGRPIRVSARNSDADFILSVQSFGPVIPTADREHIFQRFYRTQEARSLAPGTGIGLSIVKTAAEAHRGHTWIISSANEGTTFHFCLPQDTRRPGEREHQHNSDRR